jgi:hypothetical protein
MVATPSKGLFPTSRTDDVLAGLREVIARNPCAAGFGLETLARLLHGEQILPYRPDVSEVAAAKEALLLDGEVVG